MEETRAEMGMLRSQAASTLLLGRPMSTGAKSSWRSRFFSSTRSPSISVMLSQSQRAMRGSRLLAMAPAPTTSRRGRWGCFKSCSTMPQRNHDPGHVYRP